MDTLAVRLAVPLIGPAKVFHLLGLRPAGRTKKEGLPIGSPSVVALTESFGTRLVNHVEPQHRICEATATAVLCTGGLIIIAIRRYPGRSYGVRRMVILHG